MIESSNAENPFYYYIGYIKETQEIYTHGKFYNCAGYDDTELRELIQGIEDSFTEQITTIQNEVEENEKVTTMALYDLNDRKADKDDLQNINLDKYVDWDSLYSETNSLQSTINSNYTTLNNNKANKTDLETLSAEVEENEEVTAAALTELHENKADKSEIPDVSTLATKDELNVVIEDKPSKTSFKTINSESVFIEDDDTNIITPDTKVTSADNHYGYNSSNATSTTGAFVTKITKDAANHVTSFESRSLTATDIPGLDASKITSGTISIERLPAGALERMFIVESETAAMSATVQEGDVVQVTGNNNKMYFCISDTATTFETKFKEFTAGTATSVPWSGITNKPTGIDGWGDRITVIEGDYLSKTATAENSAALNGYGLADANGRNGVIVSPAEGYIEVGRALDFHLDTSGIDYSTRLRVTGNNNNVVDLPSGTGILALVSQIPTNNSQLANGAGYITSAAIPTKVSAFDNDSGYITSSLTGDFTATGYIRTSKYIETGYLHLSSGIDDSFRTSVFGDEAGWGRMKVLRTGGYATGNYGALPGTYTTAMAFAMGDTHAFIAIPSVASKAGEVVVGGGNADKLNWSATLLHSSNYSSYTVTLDSTAQDIQGVKNFVNGLTATSVICATGKLRVNTSDSINNFGYIKAVSYNTNRGLVHIGSNYGGRSDITDDGADVDAIGIYRGCVGIGRTFAGDELYANQSSGIALQVAGHLKSDGTITSSSIMYATDFSTTSDSRLKDFINDININFNEIKSIPKKYYYWKDKDKFGSELEIGTSAQDLLNIYPECVKYDKTLDMYSVNYQKLSIIALAAIDKLHERILKLELKLND